MATVEEAQRTQLRVNALFTNRVRVRSAEDIDPELLGWLREAYDAAG